MTEGSDLAPKLPQADNKEKEFKLERTQTQTSIAKEEVVKEQLMFL